MRAVIVTGMSGAGKSTVLKILEDCEYYCIDNLPVRMLPGFGNLLPELEVNERELVALGIDARSGALLEELEGILDLMKNRGIAFEILFLDADDATLVRRYKETRRAHPLANGRRVEDAISRERQMTAFLRKRADYIVDTSRMLTRELYTEIERIFVENRRYGNMMVSILSFGFKYGIPADADMVFDVRFLPNPYYVPELKHKTGMDGEVFHYVMDNVEAGYFCDQLVQLLLFLCPKYRREGRTALVVAVGCTGGKHRSVSIARELYDRLSKTPSFGWRLEHRDALR